MASSGCEAARSGGQGELEWAGHTAARCTLRAEQVVPRTRQRCTAYLMLHLSTAVSYVTRCKRFSIFGMAQLEPALRVTSSINRHDFAQRYTLPERFESSTVNKGGRVSAAHILTRPHKAAPF